MAKTMTKVIFAIFEVLQIFFKDIRHSVSTIYSAAYLVRNEQLFASKYKLYLPSEEELRAEIETQKTMFYLQHKNDEE